MKIIFNILSIVMVISVIFLAYLNIDTKLSFIIWKNIGETSFLVFHSKFFMVILIIFILGILVGSCWASAFYATLEKKIKEYQKRLERNTLISCEGNARVEVLEEKIKVLEKALQSALEKKEEEE